MDGKYSWLTVTRLPTGAGDEPTVDVSRPMASPSTSILEAVFPESSGGVDLRLQLAWHITDEAPFGVHPQDELQIIGLRDGCVRFSVPIRSLLLECETSKHADYDPLPRDMALVLDRVPNVLLRDSLVAVVAGSTSAHPGRRLLSTPFTTIDPEFVPDSDSLSHFIRVGASHHGALGYGDRVDVAVEVDVEKALQHVPGLTVDALIGGLTSSLGVVLAPTGAIVDCTGRRLLAPGSGGRQGGMSLLPQRALLPLRSCVRPSHQADTNRGTIRWETAFAALSTDDVDEGSDSPPPPEFTAYLYVQHRAPTGAGRTPTLQHAHVPFAMDASNAVRLGSTFDVGEWQLSQPPAQPLESSTISFEETMVEVGGRAVAVVDISPPSLPWAQVPRTRADAVPARRLSVLDKFLFYPYARSDHLNTLALEPAEGCHDCTGIQALRFSLSTKAPTLPGRYEAALLAFLPRQVAAISNAGLEVTQPFISMGITRAPAPPSPDGAERSAPRLVVNLRGPSRSIEPNHDRIVLLDTRGNVIVDAAVPPVQAVGGGGGVVSAEGHGDDVGSSRYSMSSPNRVRSGSTDTTTRNEVQADLVLSGLERRPLRGPATLEYRSRRLRATVRQVPVHLDDEDLQLPEDLSTPPLRSFWARLPSVAMHTRAMHPRSAKLSVRLRVLSAPNIHLDEVDAFLDGAVVTVAAASAPAAGEAGALPMKWGYDDDDPGSLPPAVSAAHYRTLTAAAFAEDRERDLHLTFPNRLPPGDYTVSVYLPCIAVASTDRALLARDPSAVPLAGYTLVSYAVTRVSTAVPTDTFTPLPSGNLPVDDGATPNAPWYGVKGADVTLGGERVTAEAEETNLIIAKAETASRALHTRPASAYRASEAASVPPAGSLVPFKRIDPSARIAIITTKALVIGETVVATLHCLKGYTAAADDRVMLVDDLWRTVHDAVLLADGSARKQNFNLSTVALKSVAVPGIYYVVLFSAAHCATIAFSNPLRIVPPGGGQSPTRESRVAAADDDDEHADSSHGSVPQPIPLLTADIGSTQRVAGPPPGAGVVFTTDNHGDDRGDREQRRRLRCVLIGCSQLATPAEVHGAASDIDRLLAVLNDAWATADGSRVDATVLCERRRGGGGAGDRLPTPAEVRRALAELVASTAAGDHVLLYYTGLGTVRVNRASGEPERCIVPTGASLGDGLIAEAELEQVVQQLRLKAGREGLVHVALDCGFEGTTLGAAAHLGVWRDCDASQDAAITSSQLNDTTTEAERQALAARAQAESDSRLPPGVAAVWHRRDRTGMERRAGSRALVLPAVLQPRTRSVGSVATERPLFATLAPFSASQRGLRAEQQAEPRVDRAPVVVCTAGRRATWEGYAPGGTCGVFTKALCVAMHGTMRTRRSDTPLVGAPAPTWAQLHESVNRDIFFGPFRSQKPTMAVSSDALLTSPCTLLPPWP